MAVVSRLKGRAFWKQESKRRQDDTVAGFLHGCWWQCLWLNAFSDDIMDGDECDVERYECSTVQYYGWELTTRHSSKMGSETRQNRLTVDWQTDSFPPHLFLLVKKCIGRFPIPTETICWSSKSFPSYPLKGWACNEGFEHPINPLWQLISTPHWTGECRLFEIVGKND